MSYSFLVHGVRPAPEFLRDQGVSYKPIRLKEERTWIAWRGRTSRGVLFGEDDGGTRIRLLVCASPDDVALAQELAAGWAKAHGAPIEAEDVPPGVTPGEPDQRFTPAQVLAWPKEWHDYQNEAAWLTLSLTFVRPKGPLQVLPGPIRSTAVGHGFLGLARERPPTIREHLGVLFGRKPDAWDGSKSLVDALCKAQDPRLARAPIRTWFRIDTLLPGDRRSRPLLHPSTLLMEPILDVFTPAGSAPEHTAVVTTFPPDELSVIPTADYVAIRESSDDWACIPFPVFLQEMGELAHPLDVASWVVERPSPAEWKAASGRMRPLAAGRVSHEEAFLDPLQEIDRQQSQSQGQSDEENELINRVFASKKAGDLQEALALAHRLAVVAPDSPMPWYLQSRVEVALGHAEAAIAALRKSIECREFNRTLCSAMYADLAEQVADQGAIEEAKALCDRALEGAPEDWEMRADVLDFKSSLDDRDG